MLEVPLFIQTQAVAWASWCPVGNGRFSSHSSGFPNKWLANPPEWRPRPSDINPVESPEGIYGTPWFIRPCNGRMAICITEYSERGILWWVLAPLRHEFLRTGAWVTAWVKAWKCRGDRSQPGEYGVDLRIEPPPVKAKELQSLFDRNNLATLLGGAQALVDHARIIVFSETLSSNVFESVLPLVPCARRIELALATGWSSRRLYWDMRICRKVEQDPSLTVWRWEDVADYPIGGYENILHEAISLGKDAAVWDLLNRPSRNSMMRLALVVIAFLVFAQLIGAFFGLRPAKQQGEGQLPVHEVDPASRRELKQ